MCSFPRIRLPHTSSCIVETLRHQEKIKTKQMPKVGAERFTKENKAPETTVFVVGAVIEPCAVAFPFSQSNDVSNNT